MWQRSCARSRHLLFVFAADSHVYSCRGSCQGLGIVHELVVIPLILAHAMLLFFHIYLNSRGMST